MKEDVKEASREELPREGIGCWHPVFPARADDVWLLASAAVKHFERVVMAPPPQPQLVIYEQTVDEEGVFSGLKQIIPVVP